MKRKRRFLIFTDLDGSFLDHRDYSPEPAKSYVRSLDASRHTVIPVTSKTRSETQAFFDDLGLDSMFVTENGSAIHAPTGFPWSDRTGPESHVLGTPHAAIMRSLDELPRDLRGHFTGFSDMTAEQVAEATGLAVPDAAKAKQREASEPFSWTGTQSELETLRRAMASHGVALQRGGRFYHLTGQCGKADAVRWICNQYQAAFPDWRLVSIALGDGPNDIAMIEAADHGVIIPNPDGPSIDSGRESVIHAEKAGPAGWVMAVDKILAGLERG